MLTASGTLPLPAIDRRALASGGLLLALLTNEGIQEVAIPAVTLP